MLTMLLCGGDHEDSDSVTSTMTKAHLLRFYWALAVSDTILGIFSGIALPWNVGFKAHLQMPCSYTCIYIFISRL